MPPASVSYGYRGKESVIQAVNDALYKGDSKSYAPLGPRSRTTRRGGLPLLPCPATPNS